MSDLPPQTASGPLVIADHVTKSYGDHVALGDASFRIEPGITGLLGANGAGKTTMLGMVIGLHPATSGTLTVLGRDPWRDGAQVRERLGYAPEHHTLPPDMAAAEFVRHAAELHGLPPTEAQTRASDTLWLVGLGEERFRAMGTMSTGQRQRVKLAQAIAHDPDLVLLDEPTDGLDPMQRDTMLDLIAGISRDFGIHVILSSHLLDEVERICDSVVIIGDGRTLASGRIAELVDTTPRLAVEFAGPAAVIDDACSRLLQAGFAVDREGPRVSVAATGDTEPLADADLERRLLTAVQQAAFESQAGIGRLGRHSRSLEDVFLDHQT